MEVIYKAFDGTVMSTFNECVNYELTKLGILLLDETYKIIPTFKCEDCYYIYVPKGKYVDIIKEYVDYIQPDKDLWKFASIEKACQDEPVLLYWDTDKEIYLYAPYTDICKIISSIEKDKKNDVPEIY